VKKNIVTESDGDKAALFANLLATQNVPAAHLTANDALPQLSLSLPDAYEPRKLIIIGEFQAIPQALPKRKAPALDGNEMLKK
jgi:hypothetical protein